MDLILWRKWLKRQFWIVHALIVVISPKVAHRRLKHKSARSDCLEFRASRPFL